MTDDCPHRQGKAPAPRFSGSRMAAGLARPAIKRGKSKIVVSYNSSELTSNAILI